MLKKTTGASGNEDGGAGSEARPNSVGVISAATIDTMNKMVQAGGESKRPPTFPERGHGATKRTSVRAGFAEGLDQIIDSLSAPTTRR